MIALLVLAYLAVGVVVAAVMARNDELGGSDDGNILVFMAFIWPLFVVAGGGLLLGRLILALSRSLPNRRRSVMNFPNEQTKVVSIRQRRRLP